MQAGSSECLGCSVQIPERKEGSTHQRWPVSAWIQGHRVHCWQNFRGPQPARAASSSPGLGGPRTLPGQGPNPPYGACLPPSGYDVEVLLKLEYCICSKIKSVLCNEYKNKIAFD